MILSDSARRAGVPACQVRTHQAGLLGTPVGAGRAVDGPNHGLR